MTRRIEDGRHDEALVDFLRTHAPRAPEAPEELEDEILAAVARSVVEGPATPSAPAAPRTRLKQSLLLGGTIAAMLCGYVAVRQLGAVAPTEAQSSEVEQFVEASWDGTFTDESELDLLAAVDAVEAP